METLRERIAPFVLGVVCCLLGMAAYNALSANLAPEPIEFVTAATAQADEPCEVCVHVVGEVTEPGVYYMETGSRVCDAIDAAGGCCEGADLQSVNLAAVLVDAQQVVVPSVLRGSSVAQPTSAAVAKINLNTATAEELETLPGIGPVTASDILRFRQDHGGFDAVEQLLDVPGIGDATLERIRHSVQVY